jgi:hypothetical protein
MDVKWGCTGLRICIPASVGKTLIEPLIPALLVRSDSMRALSSPIALGISGDRNSRNRSFKEIG